MGKFVHLHGHSEYSLLDGLTKIKKLVKRVKELEMDAVAITDHGVMYGAIEFYQAAIAEGIKPIIGCELYVAKRTHLDKEAKLDAEPYHLTALAKNYQGYLNLMKLVSIAQLDGFYYRPRVDKDLLKKYHEGIIFLSACPGGEFIRGLESGGIKKAEEVAKEYLEIFGEGNYYFELQNHEYFELLKQPNLDDFVKQDLERMGNLQKLTWDVIKQLSPKLGIPIVATNDFHYINPDDAEAQDALVCVQTGKFLTDVKRLRMADTPNLYVRSAEEMEDLFKEIPEAVANSVKIAEQCNLEIPLGKPYFPIFDIPGGKKPIDYLKEVCYEKFQAKFPDDSDGKLKIRLDYEISVIEQKKYATYFLVTYDFHNWAHENGIMTNTRGSAAGSLVLYVLGITNVNPIYYGLPFERFLNPFRPSLPDIDTDMADDRRDDIIRYLMDKYGHDKVAHIVTFGTMMGRAAIRDIGRVLGIPYGEVDTIAKLVPPPHQGFHKSLEDAIKEVPELSEMYKNNPQVKKLLDLARKVEGAVRHASVHAAGIVIAPDPLTNFTPLQREANGDKVVAQYEMGAAEAVGMVKMDLLGIRNLSILGHAAKIVKENRGLEVDLNNLPLDDKKSFEMLSKGETLGLFQLEGDGMTKYMMELKPTTIFDIMAMIALYRPGPLSIIPEYIARKRDPSKITYFDPRMEGYLKESKGLLVYQDDVLFTALNIAGYNWEEVDKFRKAMGKKIPEEMAKQKEHFLHGAVERGLTKEKAEELFKLIEPFAAYGFNKCLVGDTVIYDCSTGQKMTLEHLYKTNKKPKLLSLADNYTLSSKGINHIFQNGVKDIFELTTRRGLKIKATDNHPFLTIEGWKQLQDLKIGERIATARYAPIPEKRHKVANYRLATLGYLLAEGNLCHPHGIYYYSASSIEVNDFIYYCKKFSNSKITLNTQKSAVSVYIGKKDKNKDKTLFKWLLKINVLNKKATEKQFPEFVYKLNRDQLSLLLAKMWQGDGLVSLNQEGQLFYATSSELLGISMQHLLLRLGIISTIHKKNFKYRDMIKIGWTINISRYNNIKKFAETIGRYLVGDKRDILCQLIQMHPILSGGINTLSARGSKDIIPIQVLNTIKEEIYHSNVSIARFANQNNISVRLFGHDSKKIGYLRETVQNIAQKLSSKKLHDIGNSDIYWDEIVRILPMGKEMTYDLTVPDNHNFVANDIIVHNSHAASYAMVSYQTAYMKANYTVEFMAAVMTAQSGDTEKIAEAIEECKRLGIVVMPPDVNKSDIGFSIEELNTLSYEDLKRSIGGKASKETLQGIRFGLSAIKNVGNIAIQSIVDNRKSGGMFKSLAELCSRVDTRVVNKKALESLIKAGALDLLGSRASQLAVLETCLEESHRNSKLRNSNQVSLFGEDDEAMSQMIKVDLPDMEEMPLSEILQFEKDLLGFYIHEPTYFGKLRTLRGFIACRLSDLSDEHVGQKLTLGGVITEVKKIITKKSGAEMAFIKLSDGVSLQEAVVFPRTFETAKKFLDKDQVVLMSCKVEKREDSISLIVDTINVFDSEIAAKVKQSIEIHVPRGTDVGVLQQVNKTLRQFPGEVAVAILLPSGGDAPKKMRLPFSVSPDATLENEIKKMLGDGAFRIV